MQKLSSFIREHIEAILNEWEAFARALPVGSEMDVEALRDHAQQMLEEIVEDLETPQSAEQQIAKSEGKADAAADDLTAAQEHGAGRAGSGFTVSQMVAEFRAMRASVLRLWAAQTDEVTASNLDELTRFNEAIDQAIAESIAKYTEDIERARERFLAVLGHDLVNPLGAILTSSRFMLESGELVEPNQTLIGRIASSADRMNRLVADLLDFTRTRFGDGIPVVRVEMDARKLVNDVVSETAASHPERVIQTELTGDLHGRWDRERLAQMLSNLIGNAVQHGVPDRPIRVIARGDGDDVRISVHNDGTLAQGGDVRQLFRPMKPSRRDRSNDRRHLGLGLYIVDKIVKAHSGSIDVTSEHEHGTTFTVRLPRHAG